MNPREMAIMTFIVATAGTATLLVALEPARRLASMPGGLGRRFIHCGGLALIAAVMATAFITIVAAVDPTGPDIRFFLTLSIPLLTVGGVAGGWWASRTAPLVGLMWRLPLAGLVAALSVPIMAVVNDAWEEPTGVYISMVVFGAGWVAAPLAAYYGAALAHRRRRGLYEKTRRVTAGGRPLRPCHACGRFVEAGSGEACPRCAATIDAACWRCGYGWEGVDAAECQECGRWRPGLVTP